MSGDDLTLRVLDIVNGTIVDGPGIRTSIYFAGCTHHCQGCHNPQSWNPYGGELMSVNDLMGVIEDNGFNVTFSGGDPFCQIEALLPLAEEIKRSGKTIWCYTGYTVGQIRESESLSRLLPYIDVLVDGPFVERLRNTSLRFRGSSNQRLLVGPDFVEEWS